MSKYRLSDLDGGLFKVGASTVSVKMSIVRRVVLVLTFLFVTVFDVFGIYFVATARHMDEPIIYFLLAAMTGLVCLFGFLLGKKVTLDFSSRMVTVTLFGLNINYYQMDDCTGFYLREQEGKYGIVTHYLDMHFVGEEKTILGGSTDRIQMLKIAEVIQELIKADSKDVIGSNEPIAKA